MCIIFHSLWAAYQNVHITKSNSPDIWREGTSALVHRHVVTLDSLPPPPSWGQFRQTAESFHSPSVPHISLVAEGQTTAHGATANPEHTVWHSSSSATSMAHRLPKALKSHLDRRYELWEACELKSMLVLTNEQSPIWTLGKGQETFTAPKCPVVQPTHRSCAGLKAGIVTLVTLLI